jgi:hypothetical protein
MVQVEVYDQGALVGSEVVPIGPDGGVAGIGAVGMQLPGLVRCGKLVNVDGGGGGGTSCIVMTFGNDVAVQPGNPLGPPLVGEEVRLLAQDATGTVEGLVKLKVLARNIPGFTVVSEQIIPAPPPCPGDIDGDNDVDTTDLNILLSDFGCNAGMGNCPGDLDGDGDTDTTDLNILLSGFGQPC